MGRRHFFPIAFATMVLAEPLAALDVEPDQTCFLDRLGASDDPRDVSELEGTMRGLMLAHVPLEHRNVCGLLGQADRDYYDLIRREVGCVRSESYDRFFGRYFSEMDDYLLAEKRTAFPEGASFDEYCEQVAGLPLASTVNQDGTPNAAGLDAVGRQTRELNDRVAVLTAPRSEEGQSDAQGRTQHRLLPPER